VIRNLEIKEKELLEALSTVKRLELKSERIRELEDRIHVLLQEVKEGDGTKKRLEDIVSNLQEKVWKTEEENSKKASLEVRQQQLLNELEMLNREAWEAAGAFAGRQDRA
jgi:hypothetical protein